MKLKFQSTLPVWAATINSQVDFETDSIISIHAARVGSDICQEVEQDQTQAISIHAARVGSDRMTSPNMTVAQIISIHAARVGSDTAGRYGVIDVAIFQSTLPVWAATLPAHLKK